MLLDRGGRGHGGRLHARTPEEQAVEGCKAPGNAVLRGAGGEGLHSEGHAVVQHAGARTGQRAWYWKPLAALALSAHSSAIATLSFATSAASSTDICSQ